VKLDFENWSSSHSLVLSKSIQGKDVVIGKDLLNKVKINHGEDLLDFQELARLGSSILSCYVAEATTIETRSESTFGVMRKRWPSIRTSCLTQSK
jgi:hypothetical protein